MAEIGGYVAEGLAVGMKSGTRMVANAADGLADAATPAMSLVSNPTASYNVTAQQPQLMVGFAPTSDPILRGLRDVIQLRFGGSVDAALGTR